MNIPHPESHLCGDRRFGFNTIAETDEQTTLRDPFEFCGKIREKASANQIRHSPVSLRELKNLSFFYRFCIFEKRGQNKAHTMKNQ